MNMDSSNIKLTDIISVDTLQKIQDVFANATGMAALTVDLDGPVTELSNGTHFCMNLTRGSKVGFERCTKCDLHGGEEAFRTGRKAVYYCHGGLMDFAAPILIGKRQIGSLLGGQVLPEPPDLDKFRRIAREINVDPEDYVEAVKKIKIVPKEQIEAAAELLYVMANSLSQVGYQSLQSTYVSDKIFNVSLKFHDELQMLESRIHSLFECNAKLRNDFGALYKSTQQSQEEIEQTDQVAKYISTISNQTRLLGLNASIEAAHAKGNGLGFAIIAQEVRRLADTSNVQSVRIMEILGKVRQTIDGIRIQSLSTNDSMSGIEDAVSGLQENLDTIKEYLNTIESFTVK